MKPKDLLSSHFRIDVLHKKALDKLGIVTVEDLLYHLPVRYENSADVRGIGELAEGADAIVFGKLSGLVARKAWKSKVNIAEGWIEDGSGRIKLMWFNQPYIAKMLKEGELVKLTGKVTGTGSKIYIANPEVEKLQNLPIDTHENLFAGSTLQDDSFYPIYPESKGVTSKWFYHTVKKCIERGVLENITDPIPADILARYHLYSLAIALSCIHMPKSKDQYAAAKKRFAFEEVFVIQTKHAIERAELSAAECYQFETSDEHLEHFIKRFGFPLTGAQTRSINAIMQDFSGNQAMSRLLEGDVGSGKTAVAAVTAYAVATSRPPKKSGATNFEHSSRRGESGDGVGENSSDDTAEAPQRRNMPKFVVPEDYGNLQVAYMAPTEILAKQHFESFIQYFKHLPIQIGLITGSGCQKFPSKVDPTKPTNISKAQLCKWVENGEIPILIGTHSLVYKKVQFKHLAQVIIDEQHRFGVKQRKALTQKGAPIPHLLSMTATPIPRTLALTIYGDLDITLLDEMPAGRKKTITKLVTKHEQADMYSHVRGELEKGRQAYVICPRIDEPDPDKETAVEMKSVTAEAERLRSGEFKKYRIEVLHGKMTPSEKDDIMLRFGKHEIDILVATSVIEVGINIPNSTCIIIEGAERFGLSQLHQLRGRVIRGTHQSYCFAATASKSENTRKRLKAFTTSEDGFELAEFDLMNRGAGELYGKNQSGMTDLGMEALKNPKLVEAARTEARQLVKENKTLQDLPALQNRLARLGEELHME